MNADVLSQIGFVVENGWAQIAFEEVVLVVDSCMVA